jgi:hypothetical protein
MRAVQAALRSLGITRVRSWLVRFHLPSASCAAGWTTAVAFASSPCRCAAGSNTSTMSLCCRVKHLHHVAVLQGQTPPPCRCAAGSNTSTMSLCCRVKHLHHVAVLHGQTPPPCRCAAGSNTSTMSLCCRVKHLHHVAVLQGRR